jgi:hypothetical protein
LCCNTIPQKTEIGNALSHTIAGICVSHRWRRHADHLQELLQSTYPADPMLGCHSLLDSWFNPFEDLGEVNSAVAVFVDFFQGLCDIIIVRLLSITALR